MSILESRKTLEHAALETELAEDQDKRKIELLEKSFQHQKQKIEKEALIAKENVALVNFEQNLSNISQSSLSKSSTNLIEVSARKSSPSCFNHDDLYTKNTLAPRYKVENTEHFNELNPIRNNSFSPNSTKFDFSNYYKQLRKRETADNFIDDLIEGQETPIYEKETNISLSFTLKQDTEVRFYHLLSYVGFRVILSNGHNL